MISNFADGMRVEGQFLVASSAKSVNNLGSFYLTVELRDASGNISAKKWEVASNDEELFVAGNVCLLQARLLNIARIYSLRF